MKRWSAIPVILPGKLSAMVATALYRLALTITTSRLILMQADAGEIVYTFGNFVVGGNVAVGIIVFTIITIVQFIVITKGAERVAEVTARFTLDGMPGKQMSIDGDMRANAINAEEAKYARELLQKESRLYGSMDGAMKFVKGDAIASIIVVLVNIIGGIAIGMLQRNMSIGEALSTYAVLSVGDGLIAQIPALLISITAGLIVTRIPSEQTQNLAEQMVEEISRQPWVLLISGLTLVVFAFIPGFPTLIFGGLAACAFGAGYYVLKRKRVKGGQSGKAQTTKQALVASLPCPLTVRIGPHAEFDPAHQDKLYAALVEFCRLKFEELGLQISVPRVIYAPDLPINTVEIDLYVVPVISLVIMEGHGFAWRSARAIQNAFQSEQDDPPLLTAYPEYDAQDDEDRMISMANAQNMDWSNLPESKLQWSVKLCWLTSEQQPYVERLGVRVYTGEARIIELLDAVIERYAEDFIGVQETRVLLDAAENAYPELARELLRSVATPKISEILQRLVMEKVSIRDLRLVFEALVDWSAKEKEVVLLTEYIRISLRRQICHHFSGNNRRIDAILIGERVESMVRESIRETSVGTYSALEADKTARILNLIRSRLQGLELGVNPVLLTSMDVRRYVRKMIERDFYKLSVLSTQEMMEDIEVKILGSIEWFDDGSSYA